MSDPVFVGFERAELPANEAGRKQALDALMVLDTRPEATYDDLVSLASEACDTSIALVSLIDSERQWFKARCGLEVEETPRELSFCAHAILEPGILEVPDTLADPRFATHPAVTGEPHIRFYAGAPLIGEQGYAYGTLCVADGRPRQLTQLQRLTLTRLARQVVTHLEARKSRALAEASQNALAVEKARLEAVVNASVDVAIIATDPKGTLTLFNPGAESLLGYTAAEVVGIATPLKFHLPEEVELEGQRLAALLGRPPEGFEDFVAEPREGLPRTRTWTFVRKDGSHRQVRLSITAVRGPDGAVTGYLGMAVDVTEQLAAESKAQLAAERFSGAFAAAAQGMALVALDGRWIDANEALCQMLGYGRDELLVTDFQSLTHPDDLDVDLHLVNDVIQGRRSSYMLGKRYFHKSGRVVWARLSVSLVRDANGAPLHFVSQIQDVTDQRHAEERLRESEARVRSILDNSHDAFVAIDESGLVVEWNHSAEAAFGWRRSDAARQLANPWHYSLFPSACAARMTAECNGSC